MHHNAPSKLHRLKEIILGKSLNLGDQGLFHRLSLIAFFAWVGLGADGLSSSCYGPSEAYAMLGEHTFLAIIIGIATGITVFIISAGYSQIIELFPQGGGGYFVASKLLSPSMGMLSGCALSIDYVLTITLSIASGTDAIFSLLPPVWLEYKVPVAVFGVLALTTLNLRGVKEAITLIIPVFMAFVLTHAFIILYAFTTHAMDAPVVYARFEADVSSAHSELGMTGLILLLLKAFSMGAGTYTGIEAVSNGLPMLREPRVETGKRTMVYMAVSLAVTVIGLMCAYALYKIRLEPGKTLNASLLTQIVAGWPTSVGSSFTFITLASEALLLFAAAQTGFLGGPRILANMAMDRWLPTRFTVLSDRLVTQNGILLFGGGALLLMIVSGGNVSHLVILYSINVFITFVLSQLGMVRHWWLSRATDPRWRKGIITNGLGLTITSCILFSVVIIKFEEGGWITLLVTGCVVTFALVVKRHYNATAKLLRKLDPLVEAVNHAGLPIRKASPAEAPLPTGPTAICLVTGYNGLGLYTLNRILRFHGHSLHNLVFISIGIVDAEVFRSPEALTQTKDRLARDTEKYASLVRGYGFHGEAVWAVGTDVVAEVMELLPAIRERYPRSMLYSGQLVFANDGILARLLHNYQSFSLQRSCFAQGIPFMIIPVNIEDDPADITDTPGPLSGVPA